MKLILPSNFTIDQVLPSAADLISWATTPTTITPSAALPVGITGIKTSRPVALSKALQHIQYVSTNRSRDKILVYRNLTKSNPRRLVVVPLTSHRWHSYVINIDTGKLENLGTVNGAIFEFDGMEIYSRSKQRFDPPLSPLLHIRVDNTGSMIIPETIPSITWAYEYPTRGIRLTIRLNTFTPQSCHYKSAHVGIHAVGPNPINRFHSLTQWKRIMGEELTVDLTQGFPMNDFDLMAALHSSFD